MTGADGRAGPEILKVDRAPLEVLVVVKALGLVPSVNGLDPLRQRLQSKSTLTESKRGGLIVRVPDHPFTSAQLTSRLSHLRDGGYILTSHCSAHHGHRHRVVYDVVIAQFGDVEVDHGLKQMLVCPECGAPGGGISISLSGTPPVD